MVLAVQNIACLQPVVDETQHLAVGYPPSERCHQFLMVERVEELLNVCIYHIAVTIPGVLGDDCKGIVLAYARTEAEGVAFKVRLEDRLKHELGCSLHHTVTQGGDTKRTKLCL